MPPPALRRGAAALLLTLTLAPATLTAFAPAARCADKDPDKATTAAEAAAAFQQTPEGALRAFLASMLGPDPYTLRLVILPVSDADFAVLLASKPAPTEVRQIEVSRIASMPIRSLKAGDVVSLAGGRSFTVGKNDVGKDHVLLQMSSGPLPVLVRRLDKRWYVDAAPMIAARKTAAALVRTLPKRTARQSAAQPVKHAPAKPKRQ